ncbi:recombinase family protein [Aneurinibacillus uraniidurans]|uniref:recombinase family protein n=1 Tax=Aneurinibacillus uraniidurans TaxID=2966586 RepID=UPI002349BFEB|nr:recombinase family protein [Aneurinibacillus sp. B1]WCN38664.1 recombinase family protein [Aneurinibacillus sp. B1]
MERVCMYLRKSRADLESEARGEGETLAKHKKALLKLAKEKKLNVINIYEEIVSGESLVHRPQMLELLKEVEAGVYEAVLCMDLDRLGRGNMQEQGLILDTFKRSKTKIVTPRKTYDLMDEWDEEYSEFEAFMARKELKIITRRLQSGRIRSVEEGNYIATTPPYGYQIKKTDKERYLIPDPEQAPIVKMIFEWYTHENPKIRLGSGKIANELNRLGYKSSTGQEWKSHSVLNVIKNAVYAGRIQWKKKEGKKSKEPGKKKDVRTRPREEWIDVEGKHEPLVSMETYERAQEILNKKYHVPYQLVNGIKNPLAGLIKCGMCGASMVLRPYGKQKPHIMCYNKSCKNKSSQFAYVEARLLEGLRHWLKTYEAEWDKRKPKDNKEQSDNELVIKEQALLNLQQEMKHLIQQRDKLHDFLERGIYDEETYLTRSQNIADRKEKIKDYIEKVQQEIETKKRQEKAKQKIIPNVKHVLDLYEKTDDAAKKNSMLRSVLEYATYRKEKQQRNDDFILVIHPKLSNSYQGL